MNMQDKKVHMHEQDHILDEVLTTEPDFFLSDGFTDRLLEKIQKRQVWNQYLREFYIYLGALAGILAVLAGMLLIWFQDDLSDWMNFLSAQISLVIGIYFILIFILFIDRVLLPYFMDVGRSRQSTLT